MKYLALSLAVILMAAQAHAQLFFQVGMEGLAGDTNNWPAGENATFAIDGVGQKYLNFGKENTGVLVTPTFTEGGFVPTSITLWSANDEIPRDPASFAIYGTNDPITAANPGDLQGGFTLIATDAIALPDSRNEGGDAPLLPENSATVSFENSDPYSSFMVVFPTLKDSGAANSMQVAEIQLMDDSGAGLFSPGNTILGGQLIPEPSSGFLGLLLVAPFIIRRFRC